LIEVNGTASASLPLTAESLSAVWPQVLASVGPMFALRLKNAGLPAISGPNTLVLRFPPVYNQDSDYFGDVSRVERVEQALQKVTGQGWRVRVEAAPTGPAEPVPPTATTLSPMQKAQKQREAVEALPLFRRAIEVLGAQVVRVDEEFDAGTGLIRPPANDVPEAGEEA
jgi:hypothetical protein